MTLTTFDLEVYELALNELLNTTQFTLDEKLEGLLHIGTEGLGLQMGIISHIEQNAYTVKHFYPFDAGLQRGQVFEFAKTYCDITMRLRTTVAINPMHSSEYKLHPCYESFHLECYIGVPLVVHDALYGTLNFSSPEPRPIGFKQADRTFMKNLSQAAAKLLEEGK